jgi:hypothetical protein
MATPGTTKPMIMPSQMSHMFAGAVEHEGGPDEEREGDAADEVHLASTDPVGDRAPRGSDEHLQEAPREFGRPNPAPTIIVPTNPT